MAQHTKVEQLESRRFDVSSLAKEKRFFFKIALLSISLLSSSATAITGMLPLLTQNFPDVPQSLVESLVTVASLTTCLFTLLSSQISNKIGKKQTVQLGISLAVVAGIAPFFLQSFIVIFVCRLVFGAGIGLFTPLAISMISMFFTGNERAVLLGYQVGITALGNSIMLLIGGFLINIQWQWGFLVYLLGVPVLLIFSKIVPEPPVYSTSATKNEAPAKISGNVLWYITLCFFTFLIIWAVQLKLPELFIQKELGNPQTASLVLSVMNMGGLAAGLLFGRIYASMRAKLLPISYLISGGLIVIISVSQQLTLTFIAAVLFNFVYSFTGPYIITKVNEIAPTEHLILSTALLSVSMTLSQFATPFFWNTLGKVVGNQSAGTITLMAGIFTIIIGITISFLLKSRKSAKRRMN